MRYRVGQVFFSVDGMTIRILSVKDGFIVSYWKGTHIDATFTDSLKFFKDSVAGLTFLSSKLLTLRRHE